MKLKAFGDTGSKNQNPTEAFGLTFFATAGVGSVRFRVSGTVLENLNLGV